MKTWPEFKNCRNPVFPLDIHIPDAEAHVMPDGRVYVYGSWDQQEHDYCSREYRVLSSPNMVDWTDHGKSFSSQQVPWFLDENAPKYPGFDFSKPTPFMIRQAQLEAQQAGEQGIQPPGEGDTPPVFPKDMLYAPDCIEKDGTYYLYFCGSDQSEGVATAKTPYGPFENPIQLKCGGIDPAVFIDDDGQAYYYWGQFSANGAKLKPNMTEIDEDTIVTGLVTEQEHFFHEGSSMRKRGDTYYLVYADMERGRPTSLGYATSKSPLGPFTYQGIIIDNTGCDPASWNNHGSIEEVNGQWSVFYHRKSRNDKYMRRMCVEPITFLADGSIPEVEMTSQGAGAPFALGEEVPAAAACLLEGSCYFLPDTQKGDLAPREKLADIAPGDRAVFRYFVFSQGARSLRLTAYGEGTVSVYAGQTLVARGAVGEGETLLPLDCPVYGRQQITLAFEESQGLQLCSLAFGR